MKKTNYSGKFQLLLYLAIFTFLTSAKSYAQFSQCDSSVPFFEVDFTGNPGGSWESPLHTRKGTCCSSATNCTSFKVTLDPLSAAIKIEIVGGAMPVGSLFYQVGCGTMVAIGEEICISGVGPHYITFCKPGNNANVYKVSSISRPVFPEDFNARTICNKEIETLGLDSMSIYSIYPGNQGDYNNYLSCTAGCSTIFFSPDSLAPAYIDYAICGAPKADKCGFQSILCDTFRVYVLPGLSTDVLPLNPSICQLDSGVMLYSNASGGDGNYSYRWIDSNGMEVSTSADYFATSPGTYTFSLGDGLVLDNCDTLSQTVSVTITPNFNAEIVSVEDLLCNGGNNGSATVQATGGNGLYSYSWNTTPIQTSPTATGLTAGNYEVVINDGNGCSAPVTLSVTITEPEYLMKASVALQSNVKCKGDSTGEISVLATGGSGNYKYVWNTSPVQNTTTISNLIAGTYTVEIFDTNGCSTPAILSVTITEPSDSLAAFIISQQDVLCNGNADGEATIQVTGGSGNYIYEWNTSPAQYTATATALLPGIYEIKVIDNNGCENVILNTVKINEPENLNLVASVEPVICNENNGRISLDVSGGTAPYTYNWSNGSTDSDLQELSSGSYNVIVLDNNNCEQQLMISLEEISAMQTLAESKNVSCNGGGDGFASVEINYGTSPYSYEWNTGAKESTLTDLKAGTYHVIITDGNNCTIYKEVIIEEPEILAVDLTASLFTNNNNISIPNGNDGYIRVEMQGGALPYSYQWSSGQITADINNLTAGEYTVNITDANGCTTTASVILIEPMVLEMPTGFSPNNSGRNDSFVVRGLEEFPNNNFTVFNRWGNEVYHRENYNNEWNGTNNKGEVLPTGTYFVLLIIDNGDKILKGFVDLRK
ncbi:MAG: gliding motility-associated C-terminal domain-containing protein [Bacteroidota bacterium]|nr:gliding motility-associated C-terminal domain-containing protein [Bacteroidota bacterium]